MADAAVDTPRLAKCRAAVLIPDKLRLLAAVADAFAAGAVSLKAVSRDLKGRQADRSLPGTVPVSPASLTELPRDLADVITAVFGGPRKLYRDPLYPGGPLQGLTAEGLELAALARELVAWLDAE